MTVESEKKQELAQSNFKKVREFEARYRETFDEFLKILGSDNGIGIRTKDFRTNFWVHINDLSLPEYVYVGVAVGSSEKEEYQIYPWGLGQAYCPRGITKPVTGVIFDSSKSRACENGFPEGFCSQAPRVLDFVKQELETGIALRYLTVDEAFHDYYYMENPAGVHAASQYRAIGINPPFTFEAVKSAFQARDRISRNSPRVRRI